tara:strand:- start:4134 stop:5372 length:1239 start_codon:yes stop_codon:yes gene_type:complete
MLSNSQYNNIKSAVGTCFYIAKTENFNKNYFSLKHEFQKHYQNTNIAYSYKTNYLPTFCREVLKNGGFAEVVSSMEAELALEIGVPPAKIFFNGPFKDETYLEKFLALGGTINIDCIEEFLEIKEISKRLKLPCSVGIRCNFDIDDGVISRFGFDVEDGIVFDILHLISLEEHINLNGLHCHFASRSLESWKNATKMMCEFLSKLSSETKTSLKYVSLGGGLYGDMDEDLRTQFKQNIPTFKEYAQVSAYEFSKFVQQINLADLTLIIEPGTALVADALDFVTEIQSIKLVRGEVFVTTNGSSFNLGTAKSEINLPFEIINYSDDSHRLALKNAKVVGYTCIEGDVLHSSFSAEVAVGDLIVFKEAGSYSIVMKPPFILPNVAIVEVDGEGYDHKIVKRAETFRDIFQTYGL